MKSYRYLFDDRHLATQFLLAGGGLTATAALVLWFVKADATAVSAGIAFGCAATVACAGLALRTARGLAELSASARSLLRDDAPADLNVVQIDSSAEMRRATSAVRRFVELARERQNALIASNLALASQVQHRTHELSTLHNLSVGLAEKSELSELVDETLHALEQTIEYSSASVWSRDKTRSANVVLLGYRTGDPAGEALPLRGMRLSRDNLMLYAQIEAERKSIVENRTRHSLLSWLWSLVSDDMATSALYRSTRSWMAVPLRYREDVLGVLRVDQNEEDYFDPERMRLLHAIGSQAALAIRHARLQAQEREVAVVAERNRIARDLHDAVSQMLFAANVSAGTLVRNAALIDTADAQALQKQAEAIEKLNRGALAEMRLLMFELRPDALEHANLADLLLHGLEALECRAGMVVRHQLSRDDILVSSVRVQLHRIAQEALSNVGRHSEASSVTVELSIHAPRGAILRISDNGRGFDPAGPHPGHFGLDNMKSRAGEIGALFSLVSAPGEGTTVCIELDRAADE